MTQKHVVMNGSKKEKLNNLNKYKILCHLSSPSKQLLDDLLIFKTIESTNDYLLNESSRFLGNGVVLSEQQTKGRGRNGKSWISPAGKNIYLSLLFRFTKNLKELSGLSIVTALAVIQTLALYQIKDKLGLKWPNDIYWNFKKLAGILIEIQSVSKSSVTSVIGIGINIAMPKKWSKKIEQPFTDIETILGYKIDRNEFIGKLVNELIKTLSCFQEKGLQSFISEFDSFDLTKNKAINLITAKGNLKGIGKGINSQGHLLVETQKNKIQCFVQGEVSLQLANNPPSHLN